jgi:elongation factor 1-gamma
MVAAAYNGVALKVVEVASGDKVPGGGAPLGKLPVLVTPGGALFESNAIARFVARIRRDTELAGRTFFESAQVDSWMDFCAAELETPAQLWMGPILGHHLPHDVAAKSHGVVLAALAVLEKHLALRTYLVGEGVTLADVTAACALLYPFKFAMDAAARAPFPNVTRWFHTIVNQAPVQKAVGEVHFCEETGKAPAKAVAGGGGGGGGAKAEKAPKAEKPKEEKPKAEKKPKKKDDDDDDDGGDDMPPEPKKEDPFSKLPPSKMVLDEWKRTYSNAKPDFFSSMPWFWEHLDSEGYTLWIQKYRYNSDNTVDWKVSNTVGGFIQRCDEVRKYAFGVMLVLGSKSPYEIEGVWLIRGKSMAPMLEANPDAEYYDWTQADPKDAATRKLVEETWCTAYVDPDTNGGVGCKVFGKQMYDSKVRAGQKAGRGSRNAHQLHAPHTNTTQPPCRCSSEEVGRRPRRVKKGS